MIPFYLFLKFNAYVHNEDKTPKTTATVTMSANKSIDFSHNDLMLF
jgi:hypothetical protein